MSSEVENATWSRQMRFFLFCFVFLQTSQDPSLSVSVFSVCGKIDQSLEINLKSYIMKYTMQL